MKFFKQMTCKHYWDVTTMLRNSHSLQCVHCDKTHVVYHTWRV